MSSHSKGVLYADGRMVCDFCHSNFRPGRRLVTLRRARLDLISSFLDCHTRMAASVDGVEVASTYLDDNPRDPNPGAK